MNETHHMDDIKRFMDNVCAFIVISSFYIYNFTQFSLTITQDRSVMDHLNLYLNFFSIDERSYMVIHLHGHG
jgi:hypothetical protein